MFKIINLSKDNEMKNHILILLLLSQFFTACSQTTTDDL